MDCTKIPYFALFRQAGTVIVRQKMEVSDTCCKPLPCPTSDCPKAVHRPAGCEQCSRTRLISQYSDCDSDIVDRCRPYRSSSARSRYVNVCAAVCLVLLVGGLSPQSSAAPHKKRNMERQRRDTGENSLWANPCDYDPNSNSEVQYSRNKMNEIALQARNAFESSAKYKDHLALQLHSYESFEKLLKEWSNYEWLRKFSWFPEDALPKAKAINVTMPDDFMADLMKNIDSLLPSMYKGLKMIVAGLYTVSNNGLNDNVVTVDASVKQNITKSMHNVRAVLCLFNEFMRSRKLEILPLPDSELPEIQPDKMTFALLVYRDTLNYLEYLAQVFQKMYEVNPSVAN
ncbi:uncharacterized protein [Epargyreus clarus]|uniref:uncharacterized protein n=1 Tax=Epargyreus clarus TaxID=520877 RepID=UPI003C2E63D7